jgi:streptogramin lyase
MKSKLLVIVLTLVTLLAMLTVLGDIPIIDAAVLGTNVLYTLDADFDQGTLINVNHDAPNNDQLQLGKPQPLPFVNIAASNRGTAVRINVNTGQDLGEYSTNPDAGVANYPNPSRTTVDQLGNVWVANRGENTSVGGVPHGSITRIGLLIGGTRVDADGTPNPGGQYVQSPVYNTCVDRHGTTPGTLPDGLIKTSTGLGDILPWSNAAGADTFGGVSTAEDECIINYVLTPGTGTRTLAIDADNDVWVGNIFGFSVPGNVNHNHVEVTVSGSTATLNLATLFNPGCGGYGGFIDGNQVLWSAGRHTGLLRYDIASNTAQCLFNRGDYGLGLDPNTGHIWHSSLNGGANRLFEIDAAGNILNSYNQPRNAQGVVVDANSHVWVAELFGDEVIHYAPNPPGPHSLVGFVTGLAGTTGVAVDTNGKIWASENSSSGPGAGRGAARIDPTGGGGVGSIDLTVGLDYAGQTASAGPYNYSDMTGFVLGAIQQGTWTVIQDSGTAGAAWGKIIWNTEPEGAEPADSKIVVEARASDTEVGLGGETFVTVSNGVAFNLSGRFIEVRATLIAGSGGESPILSDIRIQVAEADGAVLDMFVVGPPAEIDVSVEVPITVREVVHNFGPFGPADFNVTFAAAAPAGCNIVGQDQIVVPVNLPVSIDTNMEATFTIHCSEPSFHTFEFTNEISPMDPGVIDPNPGNNTGATSLTVAAIAYADVEIVDWTVPVPGSVLAPDLGEGYLLISEWVTIRTVKTLHNRGPWGPVDVVGETSVDAPGIDVLGPDGFAVDDLEVSIPVDLVEDFAIHCYEPSQHTITLVNEITDVEPDDIHIVDPDTDNNRVERTLEIECVIPVPVDIKPQSCRNPLNVKKNGVLPVAILGTADFDVTEIDPATVDLMGVAPLRWAVEDVATPYEPYVGKQDAFDCTEEGADGFTDLTLKFDAQEIVGALGEVSDGDVLVLHLGGMLKEEFGGHIFFGEDVVVILKKAK